MDANQLLHCFESMNITGEYFNLCEMPAIPVCPLYIQLVQQQFNTIIGFIINSSNRYQPIDGRCVNHKYPLKGSINTPYSRIMKNTFDDCKKYIFV